MNGKKYKIILSALIIETIALISISSFAYFTANVSSNSQVNTVTTGKMSIVYEEGMQLKLDNAVPGDSVTKTFTVTNTGTVDTQYDIYFTSVANDLSDLSNITYSLKTSSGGFNTTSDQVFPNADSTSSEDITINDSSNTNLNLNVDQSVTIPSGYYAYPITVNNAIINKGPLYLSSSNTCDPGYYNGVIANPDEYKQTIYAGFYNAQTKSYSSFPGFDIKGLDTGSKTVSYTFPLYHLYDDDKTAAILNSITWYQMAGGNLGYGNITGTVTDNKGHVVYQTASSDTTAYVNLLTCGTVDETATSLTLTIYGYYNGTAGYAGGWAKCNSISIGYIIP